ncbi:MAG TPA: HD domain-containing protein [Bacteriovoracaceae bacterium]|nr:HD domain-containing protein [Bacteriovoracaceae bacterium]
MSLTLLVENNSRIESIYSLNLLTWLGLDIVVRKKTMTALETLEKDPANFKLIIVRAIIEKEDSARLIVEFLKAKNLDIPVIVIGPSMDIEGSFAHVQNSMQLKPLIQASARALGITAKEMMEKVVPDYFPIPIIFFRQLKRSVCPAYSQASTNKFYLRIEKLQEYDENFINNIIKEGIGTLYIDKMDRLEFINNLTAEFMSLLKESDLSEDETITVNEKSMELVSKKLLTMGITEETIGLARKNMDALRKTAKTSPKLSKLVERMLKNQSGYLFKHTQILTFVALHIIKNIDWGNQEQEDKITFIAFFHDIALETDAQAHICTALDLKKTDIPLPDRVIVERHAQIAAELVVKFPHSPMGADQIIRQHHGMLNGIGFSEHYGGNVSPVAIVFIVAEEFTRIILRRENKTMDRNEMMKELQTEFPNARFQKVLALLEDITF